MNGETDAAGRSGSGGTLGRASETLAAVRTDRRRRRLATAAGALVGLAAAALDPLGLALGGALVALPARSLARGVVAGLAFGLVALAGFGASLAVAGSLSPALATGAPFGLAVAIGLGGPVLGSLVRGIA